MNRQSAAAVGMALVAALAFLLFFAILSGS